jgi:urease accessory protein
MGTATAAHTAASTVDSRALVSLLHFSDTAFPTGGYAHSFGLERYCQAGIVTDAAGVERFLLAQIEGSAGPTDATAAGAAGAAMAARDLGACRALDDTLDAMKPVREFREGSRQMGRQTLRIAASLTEHALLATYLADVNAGAAPGHHAVAFGMAAGVFGWDGEAAATGFLYSTASLLVGAALRLLPMGQTEGQRVLWRLHPVITRVAREAARRNPEGMWSFTPGLDIQGMLHARLDTRLFRS